MTFKEEQRSQSGQKTHSRACNALTQTVSVLEGKFFNSLDMLKMLKSGQLQLDGHRHPQRYQCAKLERQVNRLYRKRRPPRRLQQLSST